MRRGDHSPSALAQYAREAASSVLLNGALSQREWDMVLGGKEIFDVYERAAFVAEKMCIRDSMGGVGGQRTGFIDISPAIS